MEQNKEYNLHNSIEKVLLENLKYQNKTRRWSNFFNFVKFFIFLIFISIFLSVLQTIQKPISKTKDNKPHTALIKIHGMISEDSFLGSADNIIKSLRKAFKNENAKAILLDLNSPGGSPVQSDLVFQEIMSLKKRYKDKKIYGVVADICASGCYYIAAASDKIYANRASIVGSIGVLYNGFGFVNAMDKIGIERRLVTAGKNKAILDPFSPSNSKDIEILKTRLADIHQIFIKAVKLGRGNKLNSSKHDTLFSGLFWTGDEALNLGIIDGFSSKLNVAEDIIKQKDIIDYTKSPGLLSTFTDKFGASVKEAVFDNIKIQ
tara:strand:+ start:3732 stop:4688 length:957 start_codon:yes stop_codon:yes gene_type:complete